MKTPPDWLKPGAIAYHIPTDVLFIAERLTKNGEEYSLYDAPAGMEGTPYPLAECRRPTLQDLAQGLLITRGRAISVKLEGDLITVWNDTSRQAVRLFSADLDNAAKSFARFFRGKVIEGDPDEIMSAIQEVS